MKPDNPLFNTLCTIAEYRGAAMLIRRWLASLEERGEQEERYTTDGEPQGEPSR